VTFSYEIVPINHSRITRVLTKIRNFVLTLLARCDLSNSNLVNLKYDLLRPIPYRFYLIIPENLLNSTPTYPNVKSNSHPVNRLSIVVPYKANHTEVFWGMHKLISSP